MKRRWLIGSAAVLIFFAGMSLINSLWPDRLTSEASIRRWARAAGDRDPKIRQQANEKFEKAKDPVGVCVALLQIQPTHWEKLYAAQAPRILPKLPTRIARRLPLPDLNVYYNYRLLALGQLGKLGPQASNAVPNLIAILDGFDSFLAPAAIAALERIGPGARAAVPKLVQLLEDYHRLGPTPGPLFGFPGPPPGPAGNVSGGGPGTTIIRRSYPSGEPIEAITALGQIGVRNEAVVGTLARCLTNRNPNVQLQAALYRSA